MSARDEQTVAIRSYRLAFALERRIFRVERYRLPLPYGLPLRGLGYGALILIFVLVAERTAGVGALVPALPWPVRYLVIPVGGAQLLVGVRVDGRPAHHAAAAWLGLRVALARQRHEPQRFRVGDVALAPDELGPSLTAAVVSGPGVVILRLPAQLRPRRGGRELRVRGTGGRPGRRGVRVTLKRGQRLRVNP